MTEGTAGAAGAGLVLVVNAGSSSLKLSLLDPAGAVTASGGLDRTLDYWRDAVRIIQAYEIWQVYGRFVEAKHPRFGPGVAERMQAAAKISKTEADTARKTYAAAREHIRAQITPGTVRSSVL